MTNAQAKATKSRAWMLSFRRRCFVKNTDDDGDVDDDDDDESASMDPIQC